MRAPHRRASIPTRKTALRTWLAAALFLIGCQVISGVDELTIVPGSGSAGTDQGQSGASTAGAATGASGATGEGGMPTGTEDCGPDGTQTCPDNKLCRS